MTARVDRVFLDTNVLVYLFDEGEPEKQEQAKARLAAEKGAGELVVSTQILQELYNALTRGKDPILLPDDAEAAVRDAAELTVVQVDTTLILAAIGRSRRSKISFWDSLVVEAALAAGCSRILTEDLNHDQSFGALRIDNPFAPERGEAKERSPKASPRRKKL
jgi:predicted nucleic acid-binding protein